MTSQPPATENTSILHFFYSSEQKKTLDLQYQGAGRRMPTLCRLHTGQIVEYTEICRDAATFPANAAYLGTGQIYYGEH